MSDNSFEAPSAVSEGVVDSGHATVEALPAWGGWEPFDQPPEDDADAGEHGAVTDASWSPDDAFLATFGIERETQSASPLPGAVRGALEAATGEPLGDVRLHTGPDARSMASSHDAHAVTIGRDIYFDDGELDVESDHGRHLLAHEVAHTLQQSASAPTAAAKSRMPMTSGSETEQEADDFADRFIAGEPATPLRPALSGPAARRKDHTKSESEPTAESKPSSADKVLRGGFNKAARGQRLDPEPDTLELEAQVASGHTVGSVFLRNPSDAPIAIAGLVQEVTPIGELTRPMGDFRLSDVSGAVPAGGATPITVTFQPQVHRAGDMKITTRRKVKLLVLDTDQHVVATVRLDGRAIPRGGSSQPRTPAKAKAAKPEPTGYEEVPIVPGVRDAQAARAPSHEDAARIRAFFAEKTGQAHEAIRPDRDAHHQQAWVIYRAILTEVETAAMTGGTVDVKRLWSRAHDGFFWDWEETSWQFTDGADGHTFREDGAFDEGDPVGESVDQLFKVATSDHNPDPDFLEKAQAILHEVFNFVFIFAISGGFELLPATAEVAGAMETLATTRAVGVGMDGAGTAAVGAARREAEAARIAARKVSGDAPSPAVGDLGAAAKTEPQLQRGVPETGNPGNQRASAGAASQKGAAIETPLPASQQQIADSLLSEHPGLDPKVARDAARGGESAQGAGGGGADVRLIDGGGREVTVHSGAATQEAIGGHLVKKVGQERVTEIYMQISGGSQEELLEMIHTLRNGYRELNGTYVRFYGPDGAKWWEGRFRGPPS